MFQIPKAVSAMPTSSPSPVQDQAPSGRAALRQKAGTMSYADGAQLMSYNGGAHAFSPDPDASQNQKGQKKTRTFEDGKWDMERYYKIYDFLVRLERKGFSYEEQAHEISPVNGEELVVEWALTSPASATAAGFEAAYTFTLADAYNGLLRLARKAESLEDAPYQPEAITFSADEQRQKVGWLSSIISDFDGPSGRAGVMVDKLVSINGDTFTVRTADDGYLSHSSVGQILDLTVAQFGGDTSICDSLAQSAGSVLESQIQQAESEQDLRDRVEILDQGILDGINRIGRTYNYSVWPHELGPIQGLWDWCKDLLTDSGQMLSAYAGSEE